MKYRQAKKIHKLRHLHAFKFARRAKAANVEYRWHQRKSHRQWINRTGPFKDMTYEE